MTQAQGMGRSNHQRLRIESVKYGHGAVSLTWAGDCWVPCIFSSSPLLEPREVCSVPNRPHRIWIRAFHRGCGRQPYTVWLWLSSETKFELGVAIPSSITPVSYKCSYGSDVAADLRAASVRRSPSKLLMTFPVAGISSQDESAYTIQTLLTRPVTPHPCRVEFSIDGRSP